ncbi:MAG: MlaD family protein [Myxococcota bacterium]|nr:MlaD family protein [Myxococcota bacterium]
MTAEDNQESGEGLPQAVVETRRRISPIWLIPVAAAFVAGFLFWQSFMKEGATIRIEFADAEGIQAGKTTLRFRDVVVGVVQDVTVSPDLAEVIVTATLNRGGEAFRTDGTRFWIEHASFGPQGISGVMTLVSGAYIGVDPGKLGGKLKNRFTGLRNPPVNLRVEKGLRLSIDVNGFTAGLHYGAPVIREGINVGRISSLNFDQSGNNVMAEVFIEEEYSHLIFENTRFWNASGFHVSASLSGIRLDLDSVESLVVGGLGFETPGEAGPPAKDGSTFSLYKNRQKAMRNYRESRGLHVFLEAHSRGFIKADDPVLYRGEKVGRVLRHRLHDDSRMIGIELQIFPRFEPLVREGSRFWNSSGISADIGFSGVHIHVSSIESLLEGSVSFATPDPPGDKVQTGTNFALYSKPEKKWIKWQPLIQLDPKKDAE